MSKFPQQFPQKRSPGNLEIDLDLVIQTDKSRQETDKFCSLMKPWRANFIFSNGTRTEAFELSHNRVKSHALRKLVLLSKHINFSQFKHKKVLDVGFNEGYNAIYFAQNLHCDVTGIEILPSVVARAKRFSEFVNLDIKFMVEDANYFNCIDEYDLILHLGTLYHLHDVWSAVRNTALSLRPGGYVFLETVAYKGGDEYDCKFINWLNDEHNFWALSKETIRYLFASNNVVHVQDVRDVELKEYAGTGMFRTLAIFRKE